MSALEKLKDYPVATQAEILRIAMTNLYKEAESNLGVDQTDMDYFLNNAFGDFAHAKVEVKA